LAVVSKDGVHERPIGLGAGTDTMKPEVLVSGLKLPESPRWRDGKLWFVDMYAHRVHTLDPQAGNKVSVVAEFDDQTSGLGFLLDGTPLVALKYKRLVMRIEKGGGSSVHADLTVLNPKHLNDMIVDKFGRAYVDTNSYLPGHPAPPELKDRLVLIDPDGSIRVVAEGMMGPNGLAISGNDRKLIVAEIRGRWLSSFDIDPSDGSISNKQLFADTGPERRPDGICLDAEGAVWYGCPDTSEFVRVLPGGEIDQKVFVGAGKFALACCLAGPDRRTLYMMTAETDWDAVLRHESKNGFIEVMEVGVPGDGVP
jgi:sugar lactone lactonase YvrE